jgi:D-aspartate ligase
MARAIHEQYHKKSEAYGSGRLAPTKYSKIVHVTEVENFLDENIFVNYLVDLGQRRAAENLLLIACSDEYSKLLAKFNQELDPYFNFNAIDYNLFERLEYKTTFYEICEEYGLTYPGTKVLTAASLPHIDQPYDFPVALKPANSIEWTHIHFEGKLKAFKIRSQEELDDVMEKIYASGYKSEMILQDFIPGDDSNMRVLNAYVDQNSQVRMMFLGHPLLEDPSPIAIGNYVAIIPDYNEEIFAEIKSFLEKINYVGFANFDMKYDPRDGKYKLFEINLRQGRSSFFVTLNGYNLAKYLVEDLIEATPFTETVYGRGDKLWIEIPVEIARDYIADSPDKKLAFSFIDSGNYGGTLGYKKDNNILRRLLKHRMYQLYIKSYQKYFKANRG